MHDPQRPTTSRISTATKMFLPDLHTFVVISIDPVATLDCAEDEEMMAICKELINKKYVAYIDKAYPYAFNPRFRYQPYGLYLLSQGPPPSDMHYKCQEPDMVVPIRPNTSKPTSRVPIQPGSKPLPWDDCYLSMFSALRARCAAASAPQEPRDYQLTPTEVARLRDMMADDHERRKALCRARHPGLEVHALNPLPRSPGTSDVPVSTESVDSDSEYESDESSADSDPVSESDTLESDKESDSDSDSDSGFGNAYIGHLLRKRAASSASIQESLGLPVLIVSNDLDSLENLNDPVDFFKEVALLKQLQSDFIDRKLCTLVEGALRFYAENAEDDSETAPPTPSVSHASAAPDSQKDTPATEGISVARLEQNLKAGGEIVQAAFSNIRQNGAKRLSQILSSFEGPSPE